MLSLRRPLTVTRPYNLDRLSAFCDAVIAISITILVLGLEVPSVHDVPESELTEFLIASAPSLLGYVLSFLMVGMYWMQHYRIFHFLSYADRPFVILNLIFLLCISFLPFPTGLHAVYWQDQFSVIVYAAAQIACALALLAIWLYATWGNRLVRADIPRQIVNSLTRRIAMTLVMCLLAIAVSFFSPWLSRLIFVTIPIVYLSHRALDTALCQPQAATEREPEKARLDRKD